jgi:hypothetical protein
VPVFRDALAKLIELYHLRWFACGGETPSIPSGGYILNAG